MADARFCRNCGVAVESSSATEMLSPCETSTTAEVHEAKAVMKRGVSREPLAVSEAVPSWVGRDGWPARDYNVGCSDPIARTGNTLCADGMGSTGSISPRQSLVSSRQSLESLRENSPPSRDPSRKSTQSAAWDASSRQSRVSAPSNSGRVSVQQVLEDARSAAREALQKR